MVKVLLKIKRNIEMINNLIEELKNINELDNELANELDNILNDNINICSKYNNHLSKIHNMNTKFIQCIDIKLNTDCRHELETDIIDVSCERSVVIEYCKHCFLTIAK